MVLGCVIFLATMFTLVNLMVDIIYAFVDPRIKSLYKERTVSHMRQNKPVNNPAVSRKKAALAVAGSMETLP